MSTNTIIAGTFGSKRHYVNQNEDSMMLYIEGSLVYVADYRSSKLSKYTNRKPDRDFLKEYLRLVSEWL